MLGWDFVHDWLQLRVTCIQVFLNGFSFGYLALL